MTVPDLQDAFAQADNPLINPPSLSFDAPPLDRVKPEHMLPAIEYGIAKAKANIDAIKQLPVEQATFENVVEALEYADEDLGRASSIISHIIGTNGDDNLRALRKQINAKVSDYGTDVSQDEDLFARIKHVHDTADRTTLTPQQIMMLDDTYKGYVRSGALFTEATHPAEKKRLREISQELTRLRSDYTDNRIKATAAYQRFADLSELPGVPERVLKQYAKQAEKAGQPGRYLIQLEPSPWDVLTHCSNRALREEIYRAQANLCYGGAHDNTQIMMDIVRLRHEMATMLGASSYADFVVSERMTGSVQTVNDFLERNLATYRPAAEKELAEIKAFAQQTDGLADMQPWDTVYYSRALKEDRFKASVEEARPYFPIDKVLDGVRHHAEKLFDIQLREDKAGQYPVHHPDVKVYEVWDNKTQSVRGLFYADYYARPGAKNGGAWQNTFRGPGENADGSKRIPVAGNTCNFPEPVSAEDPTLLSPDEVKTIFHEFGHAMHCLLGEGRYPSQCGTSVKWDFVELPSQLQENWVLEKEVLDSFAAHYQTGEKIPAELIKKLNDMENFGAARAGLGQTFLGMLDMAWHSTDPAAITSPEELEQSIADRASLFPDAPGLKSPSFSHIFAGGYAAGYHGYKWAEVLDADVFSAFRKNGLYDRATADHLRETIYSKGGTEEPMDVFIAMMGRKPDPDALFRREGLLPPPTNDNRDLLPPRQLPGPAFG